MAAITTAQVLALVRNIFLARLLGPEQFGLAMTLVLTMQFFDSLSDSGNDKFLIQDRDGDAPEVQNMAHFLAIGRGLGLAAGLALLAGPLAGFYGAPQMTTAFMLLGFSPLAMGFFHLDVRREQRHRNFLPESRTILWAESLGFAATIVAAIVLHSYFAILVGLIARSVTMMIVSHITAIRPYRPAYSKGHAPRFWTFGWPLLLNGPLLFFSGQGDRLLIGNQLGVTQLGLYSAAMLLIFSPSMMLNRFIRSLYLPVLSAKRDDPAAFLKAEIEFKSGQIALAMAMATGFAIIGPTALHIFYGSRYAQAHELIAAIGILQSVRFLRSWPISIAFAMGRSGLILTSNIFRLSSIPAGIAAAILWQSLFALTMGFFAGEILALTISVILNNRALGRPSTTGLFGLFTMLVNAALIIAAVGVFSSGWPKTASTAAMALAAIFILCLVLEKHIFATSLSRLRQIRKLLAFG